MLLRASRGALARTATASAARSASGVFGVAGARGIKSSTGIVGMAVEPDAKPILLSLYGKTLAALEPVPATSEYRKYVEGLTKERMAVVESTDDLAAIEDKIGCGQVEQLIEQAEDELALIPTLIAARAFDPYDGSPPEEILVDLKRCAPRAPPRGRRHARRPGASSPAPPLLLRAVSYTHLTLPTICSV